MSDYLTPAEVEDWVVSQENYEILFNQDPSWVSPRAATLREMAEICEAVAEGDAWERVCDCNARQPDTLEHEASCRYLRARKVRGYE